MPGPPGAAQAPDHHDEGEGGTSLDFRFAPEVEAFRDEVRAFLEREMAPDHVATQGDAGDLTGLRQEFERALLQRAGRRGFLGVSLPAAWGGGGRPVSYQAAFDLEVAAHDAPLVDTAITLAAHPLVAWGSPAQLAFFLPRLLDGELLMCIAYTEPDAGSDLASLTTVAEADGEGFSLTGVKSLVTGAHKADWCLTIARTRPEGPPRQGLSMFLVDMGSDGLRVRRRRTMNQWTLSEIVFDHVAVGADALLGRRDDGWRQLAAAVATEGGGMFYVGFARHALERLVRYAVTTERDGVRLADDPLVRDRLAELHIEWATAERLAKRAVWMEEVGRDNAVAAAMAKVYASELLQRLALAAADVGGADAVTYRPLFAPDASERGGEGRMAWEYLERVHGTIGGGTNEIKRSMIAQQGLGLPRARGAT
ncbi:MAG: acyl-CoA dehydrogenase family protein [Acidimicrobiales bacterium]